MYVMINIINLLSHMLSLREIHWSFNIIMSFTKMFSSMSDSFDCIIHRFSADMWDLWLVMMMFLNNVFWDMEVVNSVSKFIFSSLFQKSFIVFKRTTKLGFIFLV